MRRGVGLWRRSIVGVGVLLERFSSDIRRDLERNRGPSFSMELGRRTHSDGVFRVFWGGLLVPFVSLLLFLVLASVFVQSYFLRGLFSYIFVSCFVSKTLVVV